MFRKLRIFFLELRLTIQQRQGNYSKSHRTYKKLKNLHKRS